MSPDCTCERCVGRRALGKTPLHLKAYDDSNGPVPNDPYRRSTWDFKSIKVPDCACRRCNERMWHTADFSRRHPSYKKPIHMKASDDTHERTWLCKCIDDGDGCSYDACAEQCRCALCSFERRSTLPWTRWCGPNALHHSTESAYENKKSRNDYVSSADLLAHGGVNYDRCSSKELQRFVQQRGLREPFPDGLTLRPSYIRILNRADRARSFRFLDLPPEMRNLIYYELLILRPRTGWSQSETKKICHPQILATCHEIQEDATGILYEDNTVACDFTITQNRYDGDVGFDTEVQLPHMEQGESYWSGLKVWYPAIFPDVRDDSAISACQLTADYMLHKIANIDINVSVNHLGSFRSIDSTDEHWTWTMQNFLLVFASALMDNHNIKNLNIVFLAGEVGDARADLCNREDSLANPIDSEWAKAILYPFHRLHGINQVTITGDVPSDVAESLKAEMEGTRPAYNTWRQYCLTSDRHKLYADLINEIHASAAKKGVSDLDNKFDEPLSILDKGSQLPKWDLYHPVVIDAKDEAKLRSQITDVESLLNRLPSMTDLISLRDDINAMGK